MTHVGDARPPDAGSRTRLRGFSTEQSGATAVEYTFLLALISTAIMLGANTLGINSQAVMNSVSQRAFVGDDSGGGGGDSTNGPAGDPLPDGEDPGDKGDEEDGDEEESGDESDT